MLTRVAATLALACVTLATCRGASAVAVGVDPETKNLAFGYYKGSNITEAEARKRAIRFCLASGGENPKVVASTSRRGVGVVMAYRAQGKLRYAVVLAAPTEQRAVLNAIREARMQGAKEAWVAQTWVDE